MKLKNFIWRLDHLVIHSNCEDPSTIDCVACIYRKKSIACYPITSITVTSTVKNTKIILNAEYETHEGRNCIKLDQLYKELKEIQKYLVGSEKNSTIYMTVKKSSKSNKIAYILPSWDWPELDIDQEAFFIKCGVPFTSKD